MRRITLVVLAGIAVTAGGSQAQNATPPASAPVSGATEEAPKSIWDRETLTDRWLGGGQKLEEAGLIFKLGLTQIYQQNLRGGLATGRHAGRYTGSWDLEGELDLEKAFTWPGG